MSRSRAFPLIGFAWFVAGATDRFAALPPPQPQLVLLGLTAGLILAALVVPPFRRWLSGVDLRTVVAIHLTRFIGVYFLVLHGRGLLPFRFAVVGGWGDIAIAATALLWLVLTPAPAAHRVLLGAWNLLGLLDIVYVVATAARLGMADPRSMAAMRTLPLSLLPTFLVPLIITSHLLILWRLQRAPGRGA
jgi:hypothetical protein